MRYRHELASICGQHMKSANTRMKYPIVQSQLVLTISRAIDHLSARSNNFYKTSIQTSVQLEAIYVQKKKGIEKKLISPRIELGTFCVLSRCHDQLDHETNLCYFCTWINMFGNIRLIVNITNDLRIPELI